LPRRDRNEAVTHLLVFHTNVARKNTRVNWF